MLAHVTASLSYLLVCRQGCPRILILTNECRHYVRVNGENAPTQCTFLKRPCFLESCSKQNSNSSARTIASLPEKHNKRTHLLRQEILEARHDRIRFRLLEIRKGAGDQHHNAQHNADVELHKNHWRYSESRTKT